MWYHLVSRRVSPQCNCSVNTEKYVPGDNYDDQAPVKVDRVTAVNRHPTQEKEDDNVIDKLHHINVVKLAKYYAPFHNVFDMVFHYWSVFYTDPFFEAALLISVWHLRIFLRKTNRNYVTRCPIVFLIGFESVYVGYLVFHTLKYRNEICLKLFSIAFSYIETFFQTFNALLCGLVWFLNKKTILTD